jgi:hypothetical protein
MKNHRAVVALRYLFFGRARDLKVAFAHLTVVLLVAALTLVFGGSYEYSGKRPPKAPTLAAAGLFVATTTSRLGPTLHFEADDGVKYVCASGRYYSALIEWARKNPSTRVYAEGFLLRDGEGAYWPLEVRLPNGMVLLDLALDHSAAAREFFQLDENRGRHPARNSCLGATATDRRLRTASARLATSGEPRRSGLGLPYDCQ